MRIFINSELNTEFIIASYTFTYIPIAVEVLIKDFLENTLPLEPYYWYRHNAERVIKN